MKPARRSIRSADRFKYSRILGLRPQTTTIPVEFWNGALGMFVSRFGPPEIEPRGNNVIVFWNFVKQRHSPADMYCCFATVPIHKRLTAALHIDLVITGDCGALRFAHAFTDEHIAMEDAKAVPSFFVKNGPVKVIGLPSGRSVKARPSIGVRP